MEELDPVFDRVAAYFGLLSEPMRLKIMHTICLEEKSVTEIMDAIGATQTSVSRHLNRMHAAGALARRRAGNQVYYKVADVTLVDLCRDVCVRIAAEIDEQQPLREDLLQLLPLQPEITTSGPRKTAGQN
ncbi:MAG: ArsR/SmtB family transcription factor [Acidobacteriota bacterium]